MAPLHLGAEVGGETHPGMTIAMEGHDLAGMQAGCAGAGIDLRAQAHHAQFGECDPLAQADHGEVVEGLQGSYSGRFGGILAGRSTPASGLPEE
ncbi:hypothetical protein D3C76_1464640 [compost metagenome]